MRTLWLASFPKSGNTWMRMMISALAVPEGGELDINDPPELGGMATSSLTFDYHTLVDSSLLTHDEIDRLRPSFHAAEASAARTLDDDAATPELARPRFVKTHDAYTRLPDGAPLLAGRQGADGAVLIVRDPRDVAPSLANHGALGLDGCITAMADPAYALRGELDRGANQLRQQLRGWSGFIESWLAQTDLPTIVVRYEDMLTDPAAALGQVMDLAGDPKPVEALARAVALTQFAQLQRQEAEAGFRERWPEAKTGFFRRGEAGAWKDELTAAQVARIEAAHGLMMRRLGYEMAGASAVAAPGAA